MINFSIKTYSICFVLLYRWIKSLQEIRRTKSLRDITDQTSGYCLTLIRSDKFVLKFGRVSHWRVVYYTERGNRVSLTWRYPVSPKLRRVDPPGLRSILKNSGLTSLIFGCSPVSRELVAPGGRSKTQRQSSGWRGVVTYGPSRYTKSLSTGSGPGHRTRGRLRQSVVHLSTETYLKSSQTLRDSLIQFKYSYLCREPFPM